MSSVVSEFFNVKKNLMFLRFKKSMGTEIKPSDLRIWKKKYLHLLVSSEKR